ncbi:MAG: hypothetical protein J4N28_02055 [Chloroflexi bacterium]|nr:hypothetical protein [Chloroflexota bacterium]
MEAYQWIHPAIAAFAVLLLAATAWTKLGPKKYFRLHYALAGSTVTMMIVAIGLAAYAFSRCDCQDDWPFTVFIHGFVAALFLVFLLAQATMGVTMLVFGRKPRLWRTHRRNAKIVLGLAVPLVLLGVTTVVLLLLS